MNHLTDNEIQLFAENLSVDPKVTAHLDACELCRSHLAAYRLLFTELKKEEQTVLPKNFAQMVVARIEEKDEVASLWREWALIGLAGVLGVGISIYYAGSSLTGDVVTDSVKNLFQSRESVVSSFRQLENWFNGGLSYLIYGAFLLLVFDWLDRKLIRPKNLSGQHS